jgi:hypothetical protein
MLFDLEAIYRHLKCQGTSNRTVAATLSVTAEMS